MQGTLLFGQVTKITDPRVFSDPVSLNLGELSRANGAEVGDSYAAVGVRFLGEGSSKPTAVRVLVWVDIAGGGIHTAIRNQSDTGNSSGEALILQFRYPLVRVGFTLGNGMETNVARIEALTARGELLGIIEQDNIDEKEGPFVGLETTNVKGISTIVLDYGEEEVGEQINHLWMEFLERHPYKIYLPQVAHSGGDERSLQTTIQVQNLLRSPNDVQLKFFNQAGDPMQVNLDGTESSVFEFTLPVVSSRRMITQGSSEVTQVGYAVIESRLPVDAQAIFRVSNPDSTVSSEAGAEAAESKVLHVLPVERVVDSDLDTGIALVNPGEKESKVQLILVGEDGKDPDAITAQPFLMLGAGGQTSLFLSEICDLSRPGQEYESCRYNFLLDEDFQGSLMIVSVEPIAVTSLRTVKGVAVSSLPVSSTQR